MPMRVDFAGYTGAAGMAVVDGFIESGKVTFLNNVPDADIIADAVVVAGQVFLGDRMRGMAGEALEGAAYYAVGDAVNKVLNRYLIPAASGSTSSTGTGSADFTLAAATNAAAPSLAPSYGDTEGFYEE